MPVYNLVSLLALKEKTEQGTLKVLVSRYIGIMVLRGTESCSHFLKGKLGFRQSKRKVTWTPEDRKGGLRGKGDKTCFLMCGSTGWNEEPALLSGRSRSRAQVFFLKKKFG